MMALLKRKETPVATLERELGALEGRRDLLERKLADAAGALAVATDDRRAALLDADLDDATAASRRDALVRTAMDQHDSYRDALSAIGGKIADVETLLIAARDRAEREQTARQATVEVEALTSVLVSFREISARLTSAIEPLATRISSAADFLPRTQLLLGDIATVSAQLADEGRAYAVQIESGHRAIVHAAVPPPEPAPASPQIERQCIYVRTPIKWKEGGQTITAARYSFADPPKSVAELALARGFASLPDAEITRRTIEGFGANHAVTSPEMCLDLDALDQPAATESPAQSLPAGFIETIGTPRTVRIDANRVG